MANNGHEGDGVSNVSGNGANSNIQNTNTMIQGQGQDHDLGRVPYVHNRVLDMTNNGHEGDGISNVNVAGNGANSNIQNTDTTIQGQGQWQGRVPYLYNGVYYPGTLNHVTNVQTNYAYPNPPPAMDVNPNGYTYPNPSPAMNMNPNGYTYPNPTPPPPAVDMNPNGYIYPNPPPPPPAMDMNPNGYTYPIPPPAMDMNPNGYAYSNPRPAMDVNINGHNGGYYFNQPGTLYGGYYGYYDENALNYIHNNHYYPPYADGFYQLQQQEQLQLQTQPRRLFDAGRGRSSSGRYSNAVQARRGRGRGRGRVFRDNNYTNDNSNAAPLSRDVGNITERLMRMNVSEGERSTQDQGQGESHAEHIEYANADPAEGFSRENSNAKFFVIKSYSRENVGSSMQHGVWTSTRRGNKILAAAYGEAHHEQSEIASRPVFLFFSVKGSGNFCGVAEMDGPVDFEAIADCWDHEWKGKFPVKWNIIKDVPYNQFQHITINTDMDNQNQIPVIYSRDTQQVEFEKGSEMMDIFDRYASTSSLLDDVSMSTTTSQQPEGEGEEKQKQENTEEEEKKQENTEEEKGEKECEQSCSGSNSCDTNADHIQIEESPTELKLQEIVNSDETTQMTVQEIKINVVATCDTEETQQTDVDSSMMPAKTTADTEETHEVHTESTDDPPKATSDIGVATQVTQDNTGDTNQIMTPPETIHGL